MSRVRHIEEALALISLVVYPAPSQNAESYAVNVLSQRTRRLCHKTVWCEPRLRLPAGK